MAATECLDSIAGTEEEVIEKKTEVACDNECDKMENEPEKMFNGVAISKLTKVKRRNTRRC